MDIRTLRNGDNHIYLLVADGIMAVVDPATAGPVEGAGRQLGCRLELVLITHHHADHTGGVEELRARWGCRVAGPPGGMAVDTVVRDGDCLSFGRHAIEVLSVPGHTDHDVAYCVPDAHAVFTGDVLFAGGCGRVFGGQTETMWESLCRLRALPDDVRVFGGHDYTEDNLEFALSLAPGDADVQVRLDALRRQQAQGLPLAPSTIAEERRTNPFLRCRSAEEFARIRKLKDAW